MIFGNLQRTFGAELAKTYGFTPLFEATLEADGIHWPLRPFSSCVVGSTSYIRDVSSFYKVDFEASIF